MQAHGFRVSFTPLLEVLFTFPSRYLSTIGLSVVFSLAGWAPLIPAEFLVLRGTQVPSCLTAVVSRTGLSPSTDPLSRGFRYSDCVGAPTVLQPRARLRNRPGLGCCAFARHYLRNHCYFLFLRVLRCFSSPGSPTASMRCEATGIPHAPFFSFLSLFKRHALRMSPGRGAAARPRLLDLGRCRSISLSTRFLASISRYAGRLRGGASRSLLFAFPTCQ